MTRAWWLGKVSIDWEQVGIWGLLITVGLTELCLAVYAVLHLMGWAR
jgi:hypothetical protein